MQDVATAQCSGVMGNRIRAEHQRNPRGACRRCQHPVWFSLRLEVTEVRIRQILTHQSSPQECASLGRRSSGLVSLANVWIAVPFERELGTRQTTLSDVAKGLSREASKVARDRERIERARDEDMRIEDPDQRPDREVIEGSAASSSRDGAEDQLRCLSHNHAQLNRVWVLINLRENRAMMRTWAILRVTGGDPESRLWKKEKQRGSGSTPSMTKKVCLGGDRGRMGANPPSSPTRTVLSLHDSQDGPK